MIWMRSSKAAQPANGRGDGAVWWPSLVSVGSVPRSEDTLRPLPATRHPLAAPEIAPRHEQIGERAGDEGPCLCPDELRAWGQRRQSACVAEPIFSVVVCRACPLRGMSNDEALACG